MASETGIRPFRAGMPDDAIADLRQRIAAARRPTKELVEDRSQGVQLATITGLARYWTTGYGWPRCEAELNALPQFTTGIDGLGIHFIHVTSPHEGALPLIITHGWPGSVIEMLGVIGPLPDPAAHGGHAGDAFDLVIPSIPGHGFSAEPAEAGWNTGRVAHAWAELMRRLGYGRYVAQGGDLGAYITDAMGRQAPGGLAGIHLNLFQTALLGGSPPAGSDAERAALAALATFNASGRGYFPEQATRPQTIGYALLDTPVALAAWMLDHDTDAHYKISAAFTGGQPSGGLTRDHILDNITLSRLTGTGASAARAYWEIGQAAAHPAGQPPRPSRSRSASPPPPARSGGPRAAGPRRPTPPSATSTKPAGAATSPPGKNPNCSQKKSARHSGHCANGIAAALAGIAADAVSSRRRSQGRPPADPDHHDAGRRPGRSGAVIHAQIVYPVVIALVAVASIVLATHALAASQPAWATSGQG